MYERMLGATVARVCLLLVILDMSGPGGAQDCFVRGEQCVDSGQCCGGCCFNNVCYDTHRSCFENLDVCKDHACIGEENCVVYTPPQCPGCEPLPVCQ